MTAYLGRMLLEQAIDKGDLYDSSYKYVSQYLEIKEFMKYAGYKSFPQLDVLGTLLNEISGSRKKMSDEAFKNANDILHSVNVKLASAIIQGEIDQRNNSKVDSRLNVESVDEINLGEMIVNEGVRSKAKWSQAVEFGADFGLEVVYYDNKNWGDGFIDGETIYIWSEAKSPIMVIFGHEVFHDLKHRSPEVYGKLKNYLMHNRAFQKYYERNYARVYATYEAAGRLKGKSAAVAKEYFIEELICEYGGSRLDTELFWETAYKQEGRGFFVKLGAWFQKFMRGVKGFFKNGREGWSAVYALSKLEASIKRHRDNVASKYGVAKSEFGRASFEIGENKTLFTKINI